MDFQVGDEIVGIDVHKKDIVIEILKVRKTGVTWKYKNSDEEFKSENSNDPFFVWGWKKVAK